MKPEGEEVSKGPDRTPTIVDVARIAGVSKSTVARVIAGSASVSGESRERVLRAIEETGYEQNRFARGLRTGKSFVIGMLIPDISNPYWADVARGAQDEAEPHGYTVLISNSDWDPARERRHIQAMRRNQVDGIIINAINESSAIFRGFPVASVFLGSGSHGIRSINSVRNNVEDGVRQALEYLVDNGHRSIGIILGRPGRKGFKRFQGAVDAFRESEKGRGARLTIETGDYSEASGRAACRRFLMMGEDRPTALFVANDIMALSAMQELREAGLSCPHDMSIIGMDGIPAGAFSHPGLTTIVKPRYEMGRRAASILISALAGNTEKVHCVLDCRLLVRGSVAPLVRADGSSRPSSLEASLSTSGVP